MFLAAIVSVLCSSGLIEGPSRCVEYARAGEIVVYGAEALDHLPAEDFEHRIFVARGSRRFEINTLDLNLGEPRRMGEVSARINEFAVQGRRYADIVVQGTLSGSGGITETVDFIFALEGGELRLVSRIETGGHARSGWSWEDEDASDVYASERGLVVVMRTKHQRNLTVRCTISRQAYAFRDGELRWRRLTATELDHLLPALEPLPRLWDREALPCCDRCKVERP